MLLRRLTAGVSLVVYAWIALGVPLPLVSAAKRAGERFPCESSRCGCATAEQCWRSCCCHTLDQRLAWAKQHKVQPPQFVLEESRRAGTSNFSPSEAAPSCCKSSGEQSPPACCVAKADSTPACCQAKDESAVAPTTSVVGWWALACHGQSLKWFAAQVTCVPERIEMCDLLPPVAWLRPSIDVSVPGRCDEPMTPPPRCA